MERRGGIEPTLLAWKARAVAKLQAPRAEPPNRTASSPPSTGRAHQLRQLGWLRDRELHPAAPAYEAELTLGLPAQCW
jgi:hypothetical protein